MAKRGRRNRMSFEPLPPEEPKPARGKRGRRSLADEIVAELDVNPDAVDPLRVIDQPLYGVSKLRKALGSNYDVQVRNVRERAAEGRSKKICDVYVARVPNYPED